MVPLTIIIDGNYLFYKILHVTKGYNKLPDDRKFLSFKNETEIFIRKVATDLSYSLKMFEGYRRVIFTKDSKSWRKAIKIQDHDDYKSSRHYADDINWDIFFNLMNEFMDILKSFGIIISNIDNAEGDDLMYLWSKYLKEKEEPENVIIFTGDGDLTQLVDYGDENFIIVYVNKQNGKLIAKEGFKKWLDDFTKKNDPYDIFTQKAISNIGDENSIDIIKKAIAKLDYDEINPDKVIIEKIICGDDGDDIPSVWNWTKDGKKKRITKRYLKKVYEELDYIDCYNIPDIINTPSIRNKIRLLLQGSILTQIPPDEFENRIKTNTILAYLSDFVIPEYIIEEFDKTKEDLLGTKLKNFDNISLLKGTKFEKKVGDSIYDELSIENISDRIENGIQTSDIFNIFS